MKVKAIGFLQFAYLFSLTLMQLVGLLCLIRITEVITLLLPNSVTMSKITPT